MESKEKEKKYVDVYQINDMRDNIYEKFYHNKPEAEAGYEVVRRKIDFNFNESSFGDEYFLFEGIEGNPKYEDPNEVWNHVIDWITKRQSQEDSQGLHEDSYEYWLGSQLIEFAKKHNAHNMYMLMRRNWVEFRDAYLNRKECPEEVLEFVRGIMYKKMTEKQMWGSDEDRMAEGRVIIFDKKLMPKEGEDTGKLTFEYRPNYREEMLQGKD